MAAAVGMVRSFALETAVEAVAWLLVFVALQELAFEVLEEIAALEEIELVLPLETAGWLGVELVVVVTVAALPASLALVAAAAGG